MKKTVEEKQGFTLIEVIVVIAVVAILAAILVPTITKHINDARLSQADNECLVIGAAIGSFYKDVGKWPTRGGTTDDFYDFLHTGPGTSEATTAEWDESDAAAEASFTNQLIINDPNTTDNPNQSGDYPIAGNNAWRGPYQPEFHEDPWGKKYYCNIGAWNQTTVNGLPAAMYVISGGPDAVIDTTTDVNGEITTANEVLADDDIGFKFH
jgi:prepilin-type N-terminal cleavage/methylation domain-containing protein